MLSIDNYFKNNEDITNETIKYAISVYGYKNVIDFLSKDEELLEKAKPYLEEENDEISCSDESSSIKYIDATAMYRKEISKIPLLTKEEEKKYGYDLKLIKDITITTQKLFYDELSTVIDLETVFISLYNNEYFEVIFQILKEYYQTKQTGIYQIINKYLSEYEKLCNYLGTAPNEEELKEHFNKTIPAGIFNDFSDKKKLTQEALLKEVNNYIKYCIAKDKMITSNLRLVDDIAKKYRKFSVQDDDLINAGNEGLIKAVDKFDVSLGFKFSTYATHSIRRSINIYRLKNSSKLKIPPNELNEIIKFKNKVAALEQQYGRTLSITEISKLMNISISKINDYLSYQGDALSLDSPLEEEDTTLEDVVADTNSLPPDIQSFQSILKEEINEIFVVLNEKEKQVIKMRFGLGEYSIALTQKQTARTLNTTESQIRKIEAKAFQKLRAYVSRNEKTKNLVLYLK